MADNRKPKFGYVTMQRPFARTVSFWLAAAIAFHGAFIVAVATVRGLRGVPVEKALDDGLDLTAGLGFLDLIRFRPGTDSWGPMLRAYQTSEGRPDGDLYRIFFADHVKFQYPPSSLLVFDVLPRRLTRPDGERPCNGSFMRLIRWSSVGAALLTALASAAILEVSLARLGAGRLERPSGKAIRIALAVLVGLTFYPLARAYRLGQIQVFLDALVALGLLCHLLGRPALGGALLGACCLVKPQYTVLLLWGAMRRQWRFTLGYAAVLVSGMIASIARFGLHDHLRYLEVLRAIARQGEVYWPNQSVNGLVNRLLENGDPVEWSATAFAPFHPAIYAITLISSIAILALALVPWGARRRPFDGTIDLMAVLAASTMASPVAWEHHYGVFLPIFAALLPIAIHSRPLGRMTAPAFAASYLAMANVFNRPDLIFRNRWLGLAGSHLFFGALIVFGLLLAVRAGGPAESRSIGDT
jgi:alpha-1,2-mannosyltransferase